MSRELYDRLEEVCGAPEYTSDPSRGYVRYTFGRAGVAVRLEWHGRPAWMREPGWSEDAGTTVDGSVNVRPCLHLYYDPAFWRDLEAR